MARCGGNAPPKPPQVVYDKRPLANKPWEDFDTIRKRVQSEWRALPRHYDPVSVPVKRKVNTFLLGKGRPPIPI